MGDLKLAFKDITAGAIGGGVGLSACHPFDTVKSRIVAFVDTNGGSGSAVEARGTAVAYRNSYDCFKQTLRTEGVRGLYKGMAYPLAGQAFINAIIFSVEGQCMKLLQPEGGKLKTFNSVISGAVAGFVQSTVCSPMELIKLRMQMQGVGKAGKTPSYKGPWDTSIEIWKKNGFRKGIMKGFWLTVGRECTSFGLYFSSFRFFSNTIANTIGGPDSSMDNLGPFWLGLAGGMTGCVVWLASYPFDVPKTKFQLDGASGKFEYSGSIDCCRKLYSNFGWRIFYKGFNPCLVRGFLNGFALLPTVEYVKRYWPFN